jgi:mRNA-degrading endonuclease YafQ of YafQ-DinJ toxin-antitoxin module
MYKTVQVFKTQIFQNDVNALSFKENNFTYKRTRSLVIMIEEGLNFSHIIKIEHKAFEKPLFKMHIKGDLYIIFTLEETKSLDYTLTLLRCVRLNVLTDAVETLDTEGVVSPCDFKDFWA